VADLAQLPRAVVVVLRPRIVAIVCLGQPAIRVVVVIRGTTDLRQPMLGRIVAVGLVLIQVQIVVAVRAVERLLGPPPGSDYSFDSGQSRSISDVRMAIFSSASAIFSDIWYRNKEGLDAASPYSLRRVTY